MKYWLFAENRFFSTMWIENKYKKVYIAKNYVKNGG